MLEVTYVNFPELKQHILPYLAAIKNHLAIWPETEYGEIKFEKS